MVPTPRQLRRYLTRVAVSGVPIHYIDVTEHYELPHPYGWTNHVLCPLFDTLDEEDYAANRPFLTAVVVRKDTGCPGAGFFASLTKYKRYKPSPEDDEARRIAVFEREFAALVRYYKSKAR